MKVRSQLEIDSMRKYSSDLRSTSDQSLSESRKALDSASHLLSRTPLTNRDMKDALKFVKASLSELKTAYKDSSRSEKIEKKALRSEKALKKALLREEKKQIADMKKAEPAELKGEIVLESEDTNDDGSIDVEAIEVEPVRTEDDEH